MYIKFIKLDIPNNTIEVNWFEDMLDTDGNVTSKVSTKCVNYSHEQKADFLADVVGGDVYTTAMGWL